VKARLATAAAYVVLPALLLLALPLIFIADVV
jgi:hypothetical protein